MLILNRRYQLEEQLGAGGMAEVYLARDLELQRVVAVKLLRADFSTHQDARERFRQEARSAANLSHPNIVTVHDFGLDREHLFIVMEYVPGTDLKSVLQRRGRYGLSEAMALMVQACAGIGYAHRTGLVHCDVKPQNMLVTPERRLKVVDFGIARALATIMPDERSEIVWGSPQYFSPEQSAGLAPSPASDVYALGVVLYEMLTAQLPFTAATPQELTRMHREMLPPSPRKLNPEIPAALEQIILKVLSKEPANRYRTADQMGRVLVSFSQQQGIAITLPGATGMDTLVSNSVSPATQTSSPVALPVPSLAASRGPATRPIQVTPEVMHTSDTDEEVSSSFEIDWITPVLGLLALIAFGGLVPFWIWVYYILNPPL